MPRFPARPLKERKIEEELHERKIQEALASRNKALENTKRDKKQKKKSSSELLGLLNLRGVAGYTLRNATSYVPKSYNLDRQLVGLVSHMLVRYPVPAFLYQAFLQDSDDLFIAKHEIYRHWFVTLAQGGSFPKLVKGLMTSKEAYLFLSAPPTNRIHENVWWAKMKIAGLPSGVIEKLLERIFSHYCFDDPEERLADVIHFYARYHQDMNRVTFGEITDFLAWKLRQDRAFSLKGRTITSMIKLTNEWHVLMQKAQLGHHVEWRGREMPYWEREERDCIWTVVELRNNKAMINEGRKQKHCVYSYVQWCVEGRSTIFSLRGYSKQAAGYTEEGKVRWDYAQEQTRVTIEVNNQGAIVQVRGLLNRSPNDEEKRILRHWAVENGLRTSG